MRVPEWRAGREPSSLFVMPSPFVFADYSILILCGSEADKAHILQIAVTEFLVVVLSSFDTSGCDGVLILNSVIPSMVADGRGCWYRCLTI